MIQSKGKIKIGDIQLHVTCIEMGILDQNYQDHMQQTIKNIRDVFTVPSPITGDIQFSYAYTEYGIPPTPANVIDSTATVIDPDTLALPAPDPIEEVVDEWNQHEWHENDLPYPPTYLLPAENEQTVYTNCEPSEIISQMMRKHGES